MEANVDTPRLTRSRTFIYGDDSVKDALAGLASANLRATEFMQDIAKADVPRDFVLEITAQVIRRSEVEQ